MRARSCSLFQRRVYSLGELPYDVSRRLSIDMRESLLEAPKPLLLQRESSGTPTTLFAKCFELIAQRGTEATSSLPGTSTSWEAAKRAARHIRDPNYSLRAFYTDVRLAFPELSLYMAKQTEQVCVNVRGGRVDVCSAREEREYGACTRCGPMRA